MFIKSSFLKIFTIFLSIFIVFSCATTTPEESNSSSDTSTYEDSNMPSKISMDVPPTLKNSPGLKSMGSEVTSQAYLLLKNYVSWGMGITLFIDGVLYNLYQNRDYLLSHLGEQIPVNEGYVVFNTNTDGLYYFYLVKNNNITNIYFDWQKVEGRFKGKVKFVSDTNVETKEAVVFYDYTLPQPFLDIYVKFITNNSEGIENFRVKLIKIGE